MKFVHSINDYVIPYLDSKTGKIPSGGNFAAFNENWIQKNTTIHDLCDEVRRSCGLCAWHLKNGVRRQGDDTAITAGLLIVDIDNQADGKSVVGRFAWSFLRKTTGS